MCAPRGSVHGPCKVRTVTIVLVTVQEVPLCKRLTADLKEMDYLQPDKVLQLNPLACPSRGENKNHTPHPTVFVWLQTASVRQTALFEVAGTGGLPAWKAPAGYWPTDGVEGGVCWGRGG